jgi:hypothetical protein
MDRGTLNYPLESGRWDGFRPVNIGDEITQVIVDELNQSIAQFSHVDRTCLHHLNRIGFIDEGQKQMLKRCKFVFARVCKRQRCVDGLF